MIDWHKRFLDLAAHIATWSKDPSTKVGAVIVNNNRQLLGHGYNGFPRGVDDSAERYADRTTKYARVVHAELNAILNTGVPMGVEGCTIYCTHYPCQECAKAIIQVGITQVYVPPGSRLQDRWSESHEAADSMFKEAAVAVRNVS